MNRRRHQSGLAIVEFAITMPLLLLVMLATAEIGRAFTQYNQLAHGVRDALRFVATNDPQGGTTGVVTLSSATIASTRNLVVYGNVGGTGAALLPGLAPGQITVSVVGGNQVRVAAVYPYQSIFGGNLPSFGLGADVSTVFSMNVTSTARASL